MTSNNYQRAGYTTIMNEMKKSPVSKLLDMDRCMAGRSPDFAGVA
jgi:hypothetical protein